MHDSYSNRYKRYFLILPVESGLRIVEQYKYTTGLNGLGVLLPVNRWFETRRRLHLHKAFKLYTEDLLDVSSGSPSYMLDEGLELTEDYIIRTRSLRNLISNM